MLVLVLGNHDYRGDVLAQLNPILQKIDHRWICKRSFIVDTGKLRSFIVNEQKIFQFLFPINFKKFAEIAEFFFVDTTPFVDKYFLKPKDHKYDWRGVLPRNRYLSKLLKVCFTTINIPIVLYI